MLTKNQIKIMLDLQNTMNETVNPEWLTAKYDWMLAASMEAAEAIEHHGWKWWKKQEPNMPQVRMELVDIWHFGLSHMIVSAGDISGAIVDHIALTIKASELTRNPEHTEDVLLELLKYLMQSTASNSFPVGCFVMCCQEAGLTMDELFKQYMSKNVLNIFRQLNGYKEGTYVKMWANEEDNEHLVRIMDSLDANDPMFMDMVMEQLDTTYYTLVKAKLVN